MKILYQSDWCVFGGTTVADGPFPPLSFAEHAQSPLVKEFFAKLDGLVRAQGFTPRRIVSSRLSHSANVEWVTARSPQLFSNVDGLATVEKGTLIVVTGADCPPVFLADRSWRMIGLAHSGRKGTAANIAHRLAGTMQTGGAQPMSLIGVIGPGICGEQYEVSDEIAAAFRTDYPHRVTPVQDGKACLDLPHIIKDQLVHDGLMSSNISIEEECTLEHPDRWFSWRRDQKEGRTLEQIRLQAFFAMIF